MIIAVIDAMREITIRKTATFLREHGFAVSLFIDINSCFDIVAKSPVITLAIKVFDNIDAMRPEHAAELKKIEQMLNAKALIIGEKTKEFGLKDGIVYERYSLPALTIASFRDMLNEKIPFVKYYKGKNIVDINSELLKRKRVESGLSLSEMAGQLQIAKETLHKFEHGQRTTLETAERIEKLLKCGIIKKPEIFESPNLQPEQLFEENIEDDALAKIHDLGLKLAIFRHTPFEAVGNPSEPLMIGTGTTKQSLEKKSLELEKAKNVLKGQSMLLAKQSKLKSLHNIAIIEEEELSTMHKVKDLLKTIRERGK